MNKTKVVNCVDHDSFERLFFRIEIQLTLFRCEMYSFIATIAVDHSNYAVVI